jgi:hypothetical protein
VREREREQKEKGAKKTCFHHIANECFKKSANVRARAREREREKKGEDDKHTHTHINVIYIYRRRKLSMTSKEIDLECVYIESKQRLEARKRD